MKEIVMLRRYISESQDLSVPVNYFFELMNQDKIVLSKNHYLIKDLLQHPMIYTVIKVVEHVVSNFFNKPISVIHHFFNLYENEHFYHGSCKISIYPDPLLILFCADIQIGIVVVTEMNGQSHIFRFSLIEIDDSERKLH